MRRPWQTVLVGALGYVALVAASAVQTFSGRGPLDLSVVGGFLAVAGGVTLATTFIVAVRAAVIGQGPAAVH